MSVILENTHAGAVSMAISAERFRQGSSTVGRVLTLVIMVDEATQSDALRAAVRASREHPCRIIAAIPRPGRGEPRLDAAVMVGGTDGLGEVVELRLRGPLAHHAESVVLPLLVPDAPVVVWWPGKAPDVPAQDPVGALAQRRITDSAAAARPLAALEVRRDGYRHGDTDLAWTRVTPWRALLAAQLDQPYDRIHSATVAVARSNPSGSLLATWLQKCLGVPVALTPSRGPGITAVVLHTTRGDLSVTRPDGRVATIVRPGTADRIAALARREPDELIAEELRRLDPDDIYGEVIRSLAAGGVPREGRAGAQARRRPARGADGTTTGAAPKASAGPPKATTTKAAGTTTSAGPTARKAVTTKKAAKKAVTKKATALRGSGTGPAAR